MRPTTAALGLGFHLTGLTLCSANQEVQIPASVFSDQAFIALADLAKIDGIQVGFDDVNHIVLITQQS